MKKRIILVLLIAFAGAMNLNAIDRGLGNPKSKYIEKGTVAIGLAGGYNNYNASGTTVGGGATLLGIVNNLGGNVTTVNVTAGVSWFFTNNMSLGARFSYANYGMDLDNAKLMSIMELSNQHIVTQTYSGALAYRGYLPLFNSKVFALFGEARLTGLMGYTKNYEELERGKVGTYSDVFSLSLGLYPGISMFVTNNIAVEISLPLLEGGYQWDQQIQGQARESKLSHAFFNFQPGILGLNIGIVCHF